ncbi:MAG: tRNA pseudouridine(13) synthase TruD, partial [Myxococcales bacterium]
RFRLAVRGVLPGALERAERICEELRSRGAPNLYGPQRFGQRGDNAALGAAILRREAAPRDRFLRRLALSALQAELFNRCLSGRLRDGLFERAIPGDVLRKRETGGLFVSEDAAADTARVQAGEVDPTGPLPGHSLFAARGDALAREDAVVAEAGLDPRSFAAGGGEMEGARRPYRVPVEDLRVAPEGASALLLEFALPRGSYAACVLREVMKEGPPGEED